MTRTTITMEIGLWMLGLGGCIEPAEGGTPNRDAPAPIRAPAPEAPAQTYNPQRSFAPLIRAISPAVVAIEVEGPSVVPDLSDLPPFFRDFIDPEKMRPQPQTGEGSGFVVSADGWVITNHHVIEDAQSITLKFVDGRTAKARVLGSDPSLDVALLDIEGDEVWPYVELGDSTRVEVGDWVVAMGNPLGLGTTVTVGIISGKGRALGHNVYDDFLQTDAAINQGNSGGPLFDLEGRVIGINTAIIAGANTIGFAIPIDAAREIMAELGTNGRVARGYIGLRPDPTDEGEDAGARVGAIFDGTPADKAGIRVGDRIIAVDGQPIRTPVELVRTISRRDPGEKVDVRLVREGKELSVRVTLAERPQ